MKILSWLILFCFISNAFAATGTIKELETALNDYEYSMVVEWDQKDKAQAEAISKTFFDKMDQLFNEQNLSNDEIIKYLETRVKDPAKLQAMKLEINGITKRADSKRELAKILSENIKNTQMQGASWNGTTTYVLAIGGLLAIAALIAYQVVFNLNHYCAQERQSEDCYEVQNTECYYDYEDDYVCYDTWGTHTECSDTTSCLRWEER